MNVIQLIVGLANPGKEYTQTRHNAGAWLVEELARSHDTTLLPEKKFSGLTGKILFDGEECRLLVPTTFMNNSGQAIQAIANFYRIDPSAILIVHDELDLPAGTVKFKLGGGDGGHNGLRSTSAHLNTNDYWRLRIGISHPGDRDLVHDYVLSRPPKTDHDLILLEIEKALKVLPDFVKGDQQKAMQDLHGKI